MSFYAVFLFRFAEYYNHRQDHCYGQDTGFVIDICYKNSHNSQYDTDTIHDEHGLLLGQSQRQQTVMKMSLVRCEIGTPLILRRMMANKVSRIGSPRAMTGTTSAIVAAVFTSPSTAVTAIVYPRSILPVSPIKIFAGLKLYCKNPRAAPAMEMISWPAGTDSC